MKSSSSWKSRGCLIDFDSLKGIQTGLKQRILSASPFPRLFAPTPTRAYSWTGRYPYFRPSRLIVGNGPGRADQENYVIQLQIFNFFDASELGFLSGWNPSAHLQLELKLVSSKPRCDRTPVSFRGHAWTNVRDNKRLVLIRCWVCAVIIARAKGALAERHVYKRGHGGTAVLPEASVVLWTRSV